MAAVSVTHTETLFPGRGGATLCATKKGLVSYGGSNRSGELFSDSQLFTSPGAPIESLFDTDTRADAEGRRLPGLAGHASTCLKLGDSEYILHFGGINFVDEVASGGLYESLENCSWREIVCENSPSGRTGHSLCTVPTPFVVESSTGESDRYPIRPLREVLGGNPWEANCILFGGSSPSDGCLNDLYILTCTDGAITPESGRHYKWTSPNTTGPCPPARELHAAFIRPAIVQLFPPNFPGVVETMVRVVSPPLLCIHGGRSEDGAPRSDLCVLNLETNIWLPPVKTNYSLCSSAAAPTPDGLKLLQFGGLMGGAAGLSGALVVLDTAGAEADPESWKWTTPKLQTIPTPRFASAASCLPNKEFPLLTNFTFCVWGGMTVSDDLCEALWISSGSCE